MNVNPRITIDLVGKDDQNGQILFGDFQLFCASLALCLRRTEIALAGDALLTYRIDEMKGGSAHLTLVPVARKKGTTNIADRAGSVCSLFAETVQRLQSGGNVDARFNTDDLQAFRALAAGTLGRRFRQIRIADTRLTSQYVANIDAILNTTIPSDGHVTGRLERLNIHDKLEFTLYSPIDGFSTTCTFAEHLFAQVQTTLRRNVTVYGKATYRPGSPFPERVQVRSMEIHPSDSDLPTLRSLRGLLRGATGGLIATETAPR